MATIVPTREGSWRGQVLRKGKYASQTFRLKKLANEWAVEIERLIDMGGDPGSRRVREPKALADLVDLHVSDLQEVGRPLRSSKQAVMEAFKRDWGLLGSTTSTGRRQSNMRAAVHNKVLAR